MSSSKHLTRVRSWLLSSPPIEWTMQRLRQLLIGALRQGPAPQHIAFVMDGNRRYARSQMIETVEGHHLGFEALARILEVCYKSGVKVVTIYAFSIENFKRSKFEVDALMEMAKVKLTQLAEHGLLLGRYGAKVRVFGQRDLLRPDVLEAIDRAVERTRGNGDLVLNICFPYTSRDEITTAIRDTVEEYSRPIERSSSSISRTSFSQTHIEHSIRSQQFSSPSPERHGPYITPSHSPPRNFHSPTLSSTASESVLTDSYEPSTHESLTSSTTSLNHDQQESTTSAPTTPPLKPIRHLSPPTSNPFVKPPATTNRMPHSFPSPESITAETLTSHTFTASDPPLDILIRTSGVERLSDFMLWQCHEDTEIVFVKTLWPDFDLWQFLPVLWEWQYKQRRRGISRSASQGNRDMAVNQRGREENRTGAGTEVGIKVS